MKHFDGLVASGNTIVVVERDKTWSPATTGSSISARVPAIGTQQWR
jgi:hypothetical protein